MKRAKWSTCDSDMPMQSEADQVPLETAFMSLSASQFNSRDIRWHSLSNENTCIYMYISKDAFDIDKNHLQRVLTKINTNSVESEFHL